MNKNTPLMVPIAPGELLDKLSILEIKKKEMKDAEKLKNVCHELNVLTMLKSKHLKWTTELDQLYQALKQANQSLWKIEDDIRDCERNKQFSEPFIQLARSVYQTNDERARLKKEINLLLDSEIVEEKSYQQY